MLSMVHVLHPDVDIVLKKYRAAYRCRKSQSRDERCILVLKGSDLVVVKLKSLFQLKGGTDG